MFVAVPHPLLARGVALYAVLAVAVPTAVAATTFRGRWTSFGVPASVIDVQIAYFWAAVVAVVSPLREPPAHPSPPTAW